MFPARGAAGRGGPTTGANLWDLACEFIGWPRNPEGNGWYWTFHSLCHVFATWALSQPNIRIEDVSRLMGHSSIRVTQEIYVHVCADVYDRFFDATAGRRPALAARPDLQTLDLDRARSRVSLTDSETPSAEPSGGVQTTTDTVRSSVGRVWWSGTI